MRYITSALVSEGTSDDRFLPPLLTRVLHEICGSEFADSVEIADVLALRGRQGPSPVAGVIDLIDKNPHSFNVVFFHRDQGANAARVTGEWLDPLRAAWGDRAERLVMVVPVRETEAWLLADGYALRNALGVTWTDSRMGLPRTPAGVEDVEDPKKALNDIIRQVSRSRNDHWEQLGELVSVRRLLEVPAFRATWNDLRDVLADAGLQRY